MKNTEKLKLTEEQTEKVMLGAAFSSHILTDYMHVLVLHFLKSMLKLCKHYKTNDGKF